MENQMFCFQCQETAKNTGCTVAGVCGKKSSTAAQMDMLLLAVRGVSVVASSLRKQQFQLPKKVVPMVLDALFSTITNANFDERAIQRKTVSLLALRDWLKLKAAHHDANVPHADEVDWYGEPSDFEEKSKSVGVLRNTNEDIRSLKETIMYGLKGMAAYVEHAHNLGFADEEVEDFILQTLSDLAIKQQSVEDWVALVIQTGEMGVKAMALLDKANSTSYGHPQQTKVNVGAGRRPGILVSGHDLHDLEMLLEQTKDSGVDVYTHGEMLPAHYYPELSKYHHLFGNYGSSWWHQREDFVTFNGPILFTTNCIVPPLEGADYKRRIFTTNSTGFPGCHHIEADESGKKDFTALITLAKHCAPPVEIEHGEIVGGFAHHQVSLLIDKVLDAVKSGAIKKFVVMAGCDGRMKSREYYTEFARMLPHDCVILTAGCAKYRYNRLPLGDINGIPRVLDAGQCNDSYSLVLIAIMLRDALHLKDINDVPIVYNIAWYEQKAVIVLLALLALGIRNIHVGPTLPGFMSANVRNVLASKFGLSTITTVEEDMKNLIV